MQNSFVNEEYRYEGFHLVELPYSEDKRNLEDKMITPYSDKSFPPVSNVTIDAAKAFVRRLTTKYAPHQFTNPGFFFKLFIFTKYLVLQKFYAGLEAVALDLDIEDNELDSNKFDKIRML